MTLLAIDPGRSFKGKPSIGVCLFGDKGQEKYRASVSFETLISELNFAVLLSLDGQERKGLAGFNYWLDEVVIEDFVNNAQSKGGQRNGTSECIGAVEFACIKAGVPFTRQEPAALGPAKMHAPEGSWKPLKHLRHEDSAYLHGYEYLVRTGRLKPAGLADTL